MDVTDTDLADVLEELSDENNQPEQTDQEITQAERLAVGIDLT